MASKLIKGGGGQSQEDPSGSRIGLPPKAPPVDPAHAEAARMIARAQSDARTIRQNAEEAAQALVADATERGQQEGRESAQELMELGGRLEEQLMTGLEREALECAVDACRELLELELELRPRTVVDMVTRALGSAKHQREIFVRANPKDAVILRENKRQLLDALSRARDVDIREDPALEPGGCMIETEIGSIDARIDTQLSTLSQRLLSGGV